MRNGETLQAPVGVRVLACVLAFNSLVAFGALVMRVLRADSADSKEWTVRIMMILVGALFALLASRLWKLKNWARIMVVLLASFIFMAILFTLIRTQTFPGLANWWHFYVYPIVIVYLNLPSIRNAFKNTDEG